MSFFGEWLEAVKRNNSVLCAGLDPAEFEMGRGDEGLPEGADLRDWSMRYIEAVAPYCAAVKPNLNYWVGPGKKIEDNHMWALMDIADLAAEKGMVSILDAKLADIGSTNDAGLYNHERKGFDAVTVAPYAGNLKQVAMQVRDRNIGAICMCLMSNEEYIRERNMLVPVDELTYRDSDIKVVDGIRYVKRYIQLAHDASAFSLDAMVIGAPSKKNQMTEVEIANVRHYAGEDMLVLLPGVGKQGGEADAIWKHFSADRVIVNVGRDLMFPNGSNSTPEEQAAKAKYYQEMLNELRTR